MILAAEGGQKNARRRREKNRVFPQIWCFFFELGFFW